MVEQTQLPDELVYLVHLQSSFLSALSLHYAHNGSSAPVDIRELIPSVTRVFRKRQVTINDLQICLALSRREKSAVQTSSEFQLNDYGRGRLCIELADSIAANHVIDRHIDEEILLEAFDTNLRVHLQEWSCEQDPNRQSPEPEISTLVLETPRKRKRGVDTLFATPTKRCRTSAVAKEAAEPRKPALPLFLTAEQVTSFVASLPRAQITTASSLEAVHPLKQRAHNLLATFKSTKPSSTRDSTVKKAKTGPVIVPVRPSAASRSSSLMDRLRAKQAAPKEEKASPTLIKRRAALSHAIEIMDILTLVAAEKKRGQRSTGTATTISLRDAVQRVRQSLTAPLGDDEVRSTLELLSEKELAQEWIAVEKTGAVEYVVMKTGSKGWRDTVVDRLEEERLRGCSA